MSYFLFGAFHAVYDEKRLQQINTYGWENDIYIWFDDDITFYEDIQQMLTEQKAKGKIKIKCIMAVTFFFYSYNIYDNLTERRAVKTDGTGLTDRYEYTPDGLLQSAISQGMHYSYAYDALGRLTEKRASGRTLLSFQYDLNGNLTRQIDVAGKVTEYRYDLGRVSKIIPAIFMA